MVVVRQKRRWGRRRGRWKRCLSLRRRRFPYTPSPRVARADVSHNRTAMTPRMEKHCLESSLGRPRPELDLPPAVATSSLVPLFVVHASAMASAGPCALHPVLLSMPCRCLADASLVLRRRSAHRFFLGRPARLGRHN